MKASMTVQSGTNKTQKSAPQIKYGSEKTSDTRIPLVDEHDNSWSDHDNCDNPSGDFHYQQYSDDGAIMVDPVDDSLAARSATPVTHKSCADSPLSELSDDLNTNNIQPTSQASIPTKRVKSNTATTVGNDTMAPPPPKKTKKSSLKPQTVPSKRNPTRKNRANDF